MSQELDKFLQENDNCESYQATQLAESAWNAARDKIIEILKKNSRFSYHKEPGGRVGFDVIELPWPYYDRAIKEINNL